MTTKQFYECLFDEGELVVFGHNVYATKPEKQEIGQQEANEFFVINPIKKQRTRSIDGVQHFRNFMFEIDNDESGNPVPLEKQKEIITEAQLPWSTCTYSGGKSLHWIVSLQEPVGDVIEYRMWWKMMVTILNKTAKRLGYDLVFDANVKDPSRFSRAANAIREDKNKKQNLVSVRERQSTETILKWFSDNDVNFEDFTPKPNKFDLGEINQNADDEEKFDYIINVLMKNQEYAEGNKRVWQFVFSRFARRTGMSQDMVRYYLQKHCGVIEGNNPIQSAFSDKYDSDEPIYVFSKREKAKYAERKAVEEQLAHNQKIIDRGEAGDYLHIHGIYNYIRIGTSWYHKNAVTGKLILWDKQTMTQDFGTDHVKRFPESNKYTGFCNVVNFIDDIETIGTEYNRFERPKWKPTPGEWPTTEKLLRKVFSQVGTDQWEEGLDWIQLMITKPKQSLHCLILGSESREAGKDTFVEWLQMLLGKQNTYFADIENFLKPFNSAFADKCLIALNEVKFSSINAGSMERIKQYITQDTVLIDEKFQTPVTVDYYGKMVMLTNNVHDFMKLDDEENRFWIRTMPELDKKKEFDKDFKTKLANEIPHFVDFIINRSLKHTEKLTRFWLPESITHTSERERLVENSKSSLYLEIRDMFEDIFNERKNVKELNFSARDIRDHLKKYYEVIHDLGYVKKTLTKDFKLEERKTVFQNSFTNEQKNSRFFTITRNQILEIEDTTPDLDNPFEI